MPTQPTPTMPAPQQTTSGSDIQNNEGKNEMDIKDFKPITDSFIDYEFNVKKNGAESQPNSFFVEGEYDLNQDGKPDKINVMLQGFVGEDGEEVQTYIEVNGIKQDFYMSYTTDGEVRIIDLDKNDEFIEVAIFDEGPSGDEHYDFLDMTEKDCTQLVVLTAVHYAMVRANCCHGLLLHVLSRPFILLGLK